MDTTRTKAAATLAALAIGGLLLSGCSAASGLSKAAGCAELQKAASTLSSSANDVMSSMSSDPQGAVDKLDKAADTFDAAVNKITDDGVKKSAQKMSSAYKTFTSDMKTVISDPANADTSVVTKDTSAISSAAAGMAKACK